MSKNSVKDLQESVFLN